MTQKIYKTAQGKTVDLGALTIQNEQVRAVGNMQVNARGDKIDNQGRVISSRSQQVNKNLDKQTQAAAKAQREAEIAAQEAARQAKIEKAKVDRQARRDAAASGQTAPVSTVADVSQGLAGALARAQQIKDEE